MKMTCSGRKSIRLKNYDYSSNGSYFITILTKQRAPILGKYFEECFIESEVGRIVNECWIQIPNHFESIMIDTYIIMPNHIHGILSINKESNNSGHIYNTYSKPIPRSVCTVVQAFKASVTREAKKKRLANLVWHKNYYEHVIRDENELTKCREYITNNPLKWHLDRNNKKSTNFVKNGSIY